LHWVDGMRRGADRQVGPSAYLRPSEQRVELWGSGKAAVSACPVELVRRLFWQECVAECMPSELRCFGPCSCCHQFRT